VCSGVLVAVAYERPVSRSFFDGHVHRLIRQHCLDAALRYSSLTSNFLTTSSSKGSFIAMAHHFRLPDIHTCILCSAQEIDPLAKSRGTETFVIKYRGSRVFRGKNDCTFFSHIFGNLTLEWNDCSNDCFDLDLWIYELTVYVSNNQDSRLACGLWRSTVDDVILSPESFSILALPGKQRWYLLLRTSGD
jgi:hypothetical protein